MFELGRKEQLQSEIGKVLTTEEGLTALKVAIECVCADDVMTEAKKVEVLNVLEAVAVAAGKVMEVE